MRYMYSVLVLILLCTSLAIAKKESGTATLKDLQPAGTTDKKNKNQQYDFFFEASGMNYVCRTSYKTEMKATDFVVGTTLRYELNDHKGKIKSESGKQVKCEVVRVEKVQPPQMPQK